MDFRSDNVAGAHPAITEALAKCGPGSATPYGSSGLDGVIEKRLAQVFEHELSVFFVSTGTAANALALAAVTKPGGIVFAHRESHIIVQECSAPQYLSGGLQIVSVDGESGKMDVEHLRQQVQKSSLPDIHRGRPVAVTVTQQTEAGTAYSLDELEEISLVAKQHGLVLHMDGSRFANSLAALRCTPAEMTWKRGVDILSFGATKNGCWCAEALIFFDPAKANDFIFLRKRAGQLFSKTRFISAQLEAYLHDDLWINLARHANDMAAMLANIFRQARSTRLAWESCGNELFVVMDKSSITTLREAGILFSLWPTDVPCGAHEDVCRFVTSWATAPEDVCRIGRLLILAAADRDVAFASKL